MVSASISQRSVARTAVMFVAAVLLFFLPLTTSSIRAQVPAPAAGGGSYWICRAIAGNGISYYSDIFAAPDSAYTDMAKGFTQFLAAKYNQKNGVPTCIHYVSNQQAQTYMKQFAAGAKSILTGWKYGQTAAAFAPGSTAAPSSAPAPSGAAPVPVANIPSPTNAAPHATGEVSVLCEMTTPTHTYVSAIFSGDYKDKAKWEVAFPNYIYTNFDKFPGNGGCMTYPSAATNERFLQSWKSQPNSKILETGWVYKGPEPGPPPSAPNPAKPSK